MKILFIANSFGEDVTAYLYGIIAPLDENETVIGNMYIGGCDLRRHAVNARDDAPAYRYDKFTGVKADVYPNITLSAAVKDERWDVICLQQASGYSGKKETYDDDITTIIDFARKNCTNPDVKFYWHMTWAYDADSTNPFFVNYEKSTQKMYDAILSAVKEKIVPDKRFDGIIPSGITINCMRESGYEKMTRDGFHLSEGLGRYCAAYTAASTFFDATATSYVPEEFPEASGYLGQIKLAAAKARQICRKYLK